MKFWPGLLLSVSIPSVWAISADLEFSTHINIVGSGITVHTSALMAGSQIAVLSPQGEVRLVVPGDPTMTLAQGRVAQWVRENLVTSDLPRLYVSGEGPHIKRTVRIVNQ